VLGARPARRVFSECFRLELRVSSPGALDLPLDPTQRRLRAENDARQPEHDQRDRFAGWRRGSWTHLLERRAGRSLRSRPASGAVDAPLSVTSITVRTKSDTGYTGVVLESLLDCGACSEARERCGATPSSALGETSRMWARVPCGEPDRDCERSYLPR
jgi:hypothetical protein